MPAAARATQRTLAAKVAAPHSAGGADALCPPGHQLAGVARWLARQRELAAISVDQARAAALQAAASAARDLELSHSHVANTRTDRRHHRGGGPRRESMGDRHHRDDHRAGRLRRPARRRPRHLRAASPTPQRAGSSANGHLRAEPDTRACGRRRHPRRRADDPGRRVGHGVAEPRRCGRTTRRAGRERVRRARHPGQQPPRFGHAVCARDAWAWRAAHRGAASGT